MNKQKSFFLLLIMMMIITGCQTTPPQPERKSQETKPVIQKTQEEQPPVEEPVVVAEPEKKTPEPEQTLEKPSKAYYTVYFAPDSYTIDPLIAHELDKITERLAADKVLQIRIVGHSAKLNSSQTEDRLSLRRAVSIARYFMSKGLFDADTISISAAGSAEPAGPHAEITERQHNRRVEIHY